jgi:hypothetical protein
LYHLLKLLEDLLRQTRLVDHGRVTVVNIHGEGDLIVEVEKLAGLAVDLAAGCKERRRDRRLDGKPVISGPCQEQHARRQDCAE